MTATLLGSQDVSGFCDFIGRIFRCVLGGVLACLVSTLGLLLVMTDHEQPYLVYFEKLYFFHLFVVYFEILFFTCGQFLLEIDQI